VRRALGHLLLLAGAALLVFVGTTYARAALARDRARAAWDAAEAKRRVLDVTSALDAQPPRSVAELAPVARLEIPRIALDEIVVEGVEDESLNAGPGHLPGSALPGETGNAIISAHRDRHFRRLDEVTIGDSIVTEMGQYRVMWRVVSKRVVRAHAPALFETHDPALTLTTCWPVRFLGPSPDRLLITAVPIRSSRRA
jgi:sortase A